MPSTINICGTSPNFGSGATNSVTRIVSQATTCFAIDNKIDRATTPKIDLYHDAATASSDFVYEIDFNGKNASSAKKTSASEQVQISSNTAGAEYGTYLVNTINGGALQNNITVGNNIGQYRGTQTNTAPPAGFLGEQISSAVTGVALTTATPLSLTSITLTPGIWQINAVAVINSTAAGLTLVKAGFGVNNNSFTGTNPGSSQGNLSSAAMLANGGTITLANFRVTISTSTNYYLIGQGNGTGTITGDGRICGTRIG